MVTVSTSELGQREIGRREPDEGDAGDEAGAAEQDQRREAVELGLLGGAEGAGDRRPPRAARRPGRTASTARPPDHEPARVERQQRRRATPRTTSSRSCGCSRRVPRRVREPARQPPGQRHEHAVEDALPVETAQQRRPSTLVSR